MTEDSRKNGCLLFFIIKQYALDSLGTKLTSCGTNCDLAIWEIIVLSFSCEMLVEPDVFEIRQEVQVTALYRRGTTSILIWPLRVRGL